MTRTCTNCGHTFQTAPWDDEPQCDLCIIDSLIEPGPVSDRALEAMDEEDAIAYIKAGRADAASA